MVTATGLPVMPAGMVEVTKDEFFAQLYADPRDIMPSHTDPNVTTWETKSRVAWGRSLPGWRNPGEPRRYAVVADRPTT